MFGKGSACAWLQGMSADAAARAPAEDDEAASDAAGLEKFINTAPFAARAGLYEFFVGEGIEDVHSLFSALKGSGTDGAAQILDRGRTRLISGAYIHLRTAAERAGGLQFSSTSTSGIGGPRQALPAARPATASPGDELPDFKRLRSLLDAAEFGEPLPRALPSKTLLDACDVAAAEKGPPPTPEVETVAGVRPLATAFKERIRAGWAELLTGRATPADILNTLVAMAETALDKRQPPAVAERSSVRYGASLRHNAYLKSLSKETESQSLQSYSRELQSEHPDLVTRYLDEEASKERSGPLRRNATSADHGPAPSGANQRPDSDAHCLLWGLGLCSAGADCRFLHSCPYKGAVCGSNGGCLLERGKGGHLQTLQRREVKEKIIGKPFWGPLRERFLPGRRRRSRRRSQSDSHGGRCDPKRKR